MFVLISDIGKLVVYVPAEKRDIVFMIKRIKDFIRFKRRKLPNFEGETWQFCVSLSEGCYA